MHVLCDETCIAHQKCEIAKSLYKKANSLVTKCKTNCENHDYVDADDAYQQVQQIKSTFKCVEIEHIDDKRQLIEKETQISRCNVALDTIAPKIKVYDAHHAWFEDEKSRYELYKNQLIEEQKKCAVIITFHSNISKEWAKFAKQVIKQYESQIKWVNGLLKDWPTEISLKETKLRYSDLRDEQQLVKLNGKIVASTYYNCSYRNQSTWRSFKLSDGTGDVNVYCHRNNKDCDKLFQFLASGTTLKVKLIGAYPHYNDVCEESQLEFSPDVLF